MFVMLEKWQGGQHVWSSVRNRESDGRWGQRGDESALPSSRACGEKLGLGPTEGF